VILDLQVSSLGTTSWVHFFSVQLTLTHTTGPDNGGSPLYESPEALEVREHDASPTLYSEKSDVWSFGIVVWEIFQCRVFFPAFRFHYFSRFCLFTFPLSLFLPTTTCFFQQGNFFSR
jgi:serine/threonine protein kinase